MIRRNFVARMGRKIELVEKQFSMCGWICVSVLLVSGFDRGIHMGEDFKGKENLKHVDSLKIFKGNLMTGLATCVTRFLF